MGTSYFFSDPGSSLKNKKISSSFFPAQNLKKSENWRYLNLLSTAITCLEKKRLCAEHFFIITFLNLNEQKTEEAN